MNEVELKIEELRGQIKQLNNLNLSKDFLKSVGYEISRSDFLFYKEDKDNTWWCEVTKDGWIIENHQTMNEGQKHIMSEPSVYIFKKYKDLKNFYYQ